MNDTKTSTRAVRNLNDHKEGSGRVMRRRECIIIYLPGRFHFQKCMHKTLSYAHECPCIPQPQHPPTTPSSHHTTSTASPKKLPYHHAYSGTFAVARSKSSCVTCTLLSLSAYMPASVQTPLSSEPEQPFIFSAILVRLMPRVRFMLREWMRRMSARASTLCRR
jgi:hypothetical protein